MVVFFLINQEISKSSYLSVISHDNKLYVLGHLEGLSFLLPKVNMDLISLTVSLGLSEYCQYLSKEALELKGHPTPTNNTGSHTSVPLRSSPLTPATSVKPSQHEPSVSIPIWEVPKKESNLCAGSLILGFERVEITIKQNTHINK